MNDVLCETLRWRLARMNYLCHCFIGWNPIGFNSIAVPCRWQMLVLLPDNNDEGFTPVMMILQHVLIDWGVFWAHRYSCAYKMWGYECCLFLFCFLAMLTWRIMFCCVFVVMSCFLGDVMVFKFYAKIRYLSEGVVPLFHNNLCVIKIYREFYRVICFNSLRAFNVNKIEIFLCYQNV